jgi:hypothetical protein
VHLRYAQGVRVSVELDSRECLELLVEEDLREAAVDVTPACRKCRVLFGNQHFLLEDSIVAIARDAECARLKAVQSASEIPRVCVEPVCVNRSPRSCTDLARQQCTCEWVVEEKAAY